MPNLVRISDCARTGGAGDLFNPIKSNHYSTVGLHLKAHALHSLVGRVGAFGDFDSDQFTDLFWIHDDAELDAHVSVQRWNHRTDEFEAVPGAAVRLPAGHQGSSSGNRSQLAAVPSDFNFDGRMDLLLVSTDMDSGESDLLLYFGGYGMAPPFVGSEATTEDSTRREGKRGQKASPRLGARPLLVGRAMGQVREPKG